jgi:hypothetical protein
LNACDALVSRFGEATDPKLREATANALLNKGEIARELGREEDANIAYREVIARFREATEPFLAERVAQACRELDAIQPLP